MESIALLSIGKRRTQLLHHRLDLLYEDNNICGASTSRVSTRRGRSFLTVEM